jgi:hypothetical protein
MLRLIDASQIHSLTSEFSLLRISILHTEQILLQLVNKELLIGYGTVLHTKLTQHQIMIVMMTVNEEGWKREWTQFA